MATTSRKGGSSSKRGSSGGRSSASKKGGSSRGGSGRSSSASSRGSSRGGSSRGGSARGSSARGGSSRGASSARRGTSARGGSSRKSSGGGARRQPNAAFMKPMQPSQELSAVVGGDPMPRTEVTKKLWAYIKRNNLQDQKERRMINADDNLRPIFGGKRQVSMFDMTKMVNKHLS